MADARHHNPGQPPLLPPELQEAFRQALLQPHPRDGVWTIRNAAECRSPGPASTTAWASPWGPSPSWTYAVLKIPDKMGLR
jgi:hypothetical protein